MNKLIQKIALSALLAGTATVADAQQYHSLDSTFGSDGISRLSQIFTYHHMSQPLDITMQTDGKFICFFNDMCHTFVMRLNADGTLDPTFVAGSGYEVFPNSVPGVIQFTGSISTYAQSLVRQTSNGKIIVSLAGSAWLRLNANGSLDQTYGNLTGIPGYFDPNDGNNYREVYHTYDFYEGMNAHYMASKITPFNGYTDTLMMLKTSLDGDLDNSYGINGFKLIPLDTAKFGYTNYVSDIIFTNDGKILFTGQCKRAGYPANQEDAFVALYNVDGTPVSTFGNNGVAFLNFNNMSEQGFVVTRSTSGDVFVSGTCGSSIVSLDKLFTAKLLANGTVDMAFGNNGIALHSTPYTGGSMHPLSIATTVGNKVYTVGFYNPSVNVYHDDVFSFNADGSPNVEFAPAGTIDNNAFEHFRTLLRTPENKMMLIAADTQARILRFKGDPDALAVNHIRSLATKAWTSNGKAFIQSQGDVADMSAALLSIDGKLVHKYSNGDFTANGKDIKSVQLPGDLAHGTYILSVQSSKGAHQVKFTY